MNTKVYAPPRGASRFRAAFSSMCAVATLAAASLANAAPLTWSIVGPGSTVVDAYGQKTWLSYDLQHANTEFHTWTVSTITNRSGQYRFGWTITVYDAFFLESLTLEAHSPLLWSSLLNTSSASCCTLPSHGFWKSGTYTFKDVKAGEILRFDLGSGNDDSNSPLVGTLMLQEFPSARAIPEPTSLSLILLGLAGFAVAKRRSSTRGIRAFSETS